MDLLCLTQTKPPLPSPLTISNLGPSWQEVLSLMETLHETDNSLSPSQLSSLTSGCDNIDLCLKSFSDRRFEVAVWVYNPIPSIQHEFWSSVCSGTFGNRILEVLNPNLPTVIFLLSEFPGKAWDPTPGLQLRLNCWLFPQLPCRSWPVT